ncbi:MAG: YncE family protein, partial [Thermoplasmata archaeon]|nr:YncE family protein [Thermoplasmata archaeon]
MVSLLLTLLVGATFLPMVVASAAETATATAPPRALVPPVGPGLLLSLSNGTVGTAVSASGSGFAPNSSIALSFAGTAVPTVCSTDATGDFPGASGTPCNFTVPAAPAGAESVVASAAGAPPVSIGVGMNPSDPAYDSGTDQVFVPNYSGNNVSVISDATDTVVTSVRVGTGPISAVYDSGKSEIFVTNYQTNNVSVISDTNDTVVANIAVGSGPYGGIAYDSGTGEVFVANFGSGNVSVISDTNDTVVATMAVGSQPFGIAYDAHTGQVFVSVRGANSVSVISDSTNSVVSTIGTGGGPSGVTYDPGRSEVFVVNYATNNVSVINDTTDSVVANVLVGTAPFGSAYDATAGEVYVANYGSNNVSVINDATNTVESTIAVGAGPFGDVFDAGTGTVFVPDSNSANVTAISTGGPHATASFTVDTNLTASPSNGSAGDVVHASGTGFAASTPITFTLAGTTVASVCSTDSTGSFPGTSGTGCVLVVPTAPVGPQTLAATDGTNQANTTFVVMGTPPTGLVLTPTNGTVGTSVSATGRGFAANATIAFTFAGVPVASTCLADASGNFPGASGTPCTFLVPTVPAGNESVVAVGGTPNLQGIGVGSESSWIAYDSGTDELFVANYGNNNVSVISDASDSVVASVPVGVGPVGVAYDSALGEVFATNYQGNSVSVISDSTNAVVATIGVGSGPYSAAYDPSTGEVFVGNLGSSNVSVISDSTNTVVATVPVGANPFDTAYDASTGEIFVANHGSSDVSIISDSANAVVATVPAGSVTSGVAYDASTGQVFVANYGSNNVTVINDTTDTVVANILVGTGPFGVTVDPSTGEVFVANYASNNVSVINDTTDTVVATVPVGGGPFGIVYDSGVSKVFVADYATNNVTLIATGGRHIEAGFTVEPTLTLTPTNGDIASTVAATGTGFSKDSPITFTFAGITVTSACATDATGSFPGTTGTTCRFTVPSTATGAENVVASDGTYATTATYNVTGGLSLSPTNGSVGTLVAATGVGFAASSTISFTFAGISVASSCSTDPQGDFPGTSGTACTFTVPAVPNGRESVAATDGSTTATAPYLVKASLQISRESGGFGSPLTATGTGFAANSPITFTVAGVQANSSCATDSTGSFPGSSGTSCAFTVPSAPGGAESIVASNDNLSAGIEVGGSPSLLAYDPTAGEVFVANYGSNNVSVISDATNTVVASVTVGEGPFAAAYDPAQGEVFVTNHEANTVSVISDASDAVVATISVGNAPLGIAYDPSAGELFVADASTNDVSVISDSTDMVVATIAVGSAPYDVAYDSGTGEIFVSNHGSNNVSVIADSNNSVVANVPVGSIASNLAYDAGTDEVFVSDYGSNQVSVISDATDTVFGTIGVGSGPFGVAYDPSTSELFVDNANSNNVNVISDSTDAVVATLGVGTTPFGAAYDPATGEVYVTDDGSNNVSVISAGHASATFEVNSSLGLNTTTGTVDVGQPVSIVGTGFGSSLLISTFTLGADLLNCTVASTGTCMGGALQTSSVGSFDAQFTAPSVGTSGSYTVTVTDTAGNSATATIKVYTDPRAVILTASPNDVDVGQTTTFSLTAAAGTGGYTFAWSGLPKGCSGSTATVLCTPTEAETTSVSVEITDSNGYSATSPDVSFTANADPVVEIPNSDPAYGQVDAGQSVTFTTIASFGTGTYELYNWTGLPAGCSGSTALVVCAGADLPASQYLISVSVTDSNGFTSAPSAGLLFLVNPDPTVGTPSASVASA